MNPRTAILELARRILAGEDPEELAKDVLHFYGEPAPQQKPEPPGPRLVEPEPKPKKAPPRKGK